MPRGKRKSGPIGLDGPTPYQRKKWRRVWRVFPRMVDVLPEGEQGRVKVSHFDVCQGRALMESINRNEVWTTGRFCSLEIDGTGWMYDIYHERVMNLRPVDHARGEVLIGGLGLGMILWPILAKQEVTGVTVIENSADVTALVLPSLDRAPGREKLRMVMGDGKRPERLGLGKYDAIWLDFVPCYGYGHPMLTLHEEWCERYQPFLAHGDAYLDHWGMQENLQYLLGWTKRSAFPLGAPIAKLHVTHRTNDPDDPATWDWSELDEERDEVAA